MDEEIIAWVDREHMNNEPKGGFIYGGEDGWREEITKEIMVGHIWHDYTSRH